jgi:hypothetical protein
MAFCRIKKHVDSMNLLLHLIKKPFSTALHQKI